MSTYKTPKGTELPILFLKGKDYLQVAHRLVWFREERPGWGIETRFIKLSPEVSVVRATIKDETGRVIAMGTKSETPKGFADYIEKSETGAIGRALALCGFGTQFCSDELDEGERIVDSPVARKPEPVSNDPLKYLITVGVNKGKTIGDLSVFEVENDMKYWKSQKSPRQGAVEYMKVAIPWLESRLVKVAK